MKTVIEMAREAGFDPRYCSEDFNIHKFAELVRADERAKIHPKKLKSLEKDSYCYGDERYYANE